MAANESYWPAKSQVASGSFNGPPRGSRLALGVMKKKNLLNKARIKFATTLLRTEEHCPLQAQGVVRSHEFLFYFYVGLCGNDNGVAVLQLRRTTRYANNVRAHAAGRPWSTIRLRCTLYTFKESRVKSICVQAHCRMFRGRKRIEFKLERKTKTKNFKYTENIF